MKDKKYKYVEDIIEDYLALTDEQVEIPLLITKAYEKYDSYLPEQSGSVIKPDEAEDLFKVFMNIKKHEERKTEIVQEINHIETLLKEFLGFIKDNKVSYERRDDNKVKTTYLFWIEDDIIKSNR